MKRTLPLILGFACLTAGAAIAEDWITLSGIGDRVTLEPGQTALVVAVSGRVTLQYDKDGRHRTWVKLQPDNRDPQPTYVASRRPTDAVVSYRKPFPLSGPATVGVGSPGVVTLRILGPAKQE